MSSRVSTAPKPRGKKRTRVLMTATVFTPEGAHKVVMRDISVYGAQVISEMAMSSDRDAILKRGSLFVAARITWAIEKEAGLAFYRELAPEELESTFHEVLRAA